MKLRQFANAVNGQVVLSRFFAKTIDLLSNRSAWPAPALVEVKQ